jgi:hypothetical protein
VAGSLELSFVPAIRRPWDVVAKPHALLRSTRTTRSLILRESQRVRCTRYAEDRGPPGNLLVLALKSTLSLFAVDSAVARIQPVHSDVRDIPASMGEPHRTSVWTDEFPVDDSAGSC